jgi:SAM-dependent methyltransferase
VARDVLHTKVEQFFAERFREHGATARGVDWQSEEAQDAAFDQLLRIADGHRSFSLVDYGCGYGALVPYLNSRGFDVDYTGFDIADSMISHARDAYGAECQFTADERALGTADFVVASGIFNVRLDVEEAEWTEHILATIARFDALSRLGFAFNMLTSYSDPDKMRPDLYYGDGKFFFDVCKTRYARNVALLHDYGRWQWTLLVRKDQS